MPNRRNHGGKEPQDARAEARERIAEIFAEALSRESASAVAPPSIAAPESSALAARLKTAETERDRANDLIRQMLALCKATEAKLIAHLQAQVQTADKRQS